MASISQLTSRVIDLFGSPATADPSKLMNNLGVSSGGNVIVGAATSTDTSTAKLQVTGKASVDGLILPDGYIQVLTPTGRNVIINGDMRVQQRSNLVCSAGVGGYGPADRWGALNAASAGGQFTQSVGTITWNSVAYAASIQTVNTVIANSSGANYWTGFYQPIEGYNCFHFLGQPASLSFIFNSNVTGTFSISIRDYTGNNSFVTTFSYTTANTPKKITINVPTIPTSLSIPNSNAGGMYLNIGAINTSGTYQTSTTGAWQSGNYMYAAGATNWGGTVNNFIAITQVKLELGTQITPYEWIEYGELFRRCQRYYQSFSGTVFVGAGASQSTTLAYVSIPLNTAMRSAPTIGYSGGPPQLYGPTAGVQNVTSFGTMYYSGGALGVGVNTAANQTLGQAVELYANGGTIYLGSEL